MGIYCIYLLLLCLMRRLEIMLTDGADLMSSRLIRLPTHILTIDSQLASHRLVKFQLTTLDLQLAFHRLVKLQLTTSDSQLASLRLGELLLTTH